jgi:excinuclease ABC subunit C
MKTQSRKMQFEEAARTRDLLSKIYYVRQNFNTPEEYIDNPYLRDDVAERALRELVDAIPILKSTPKRIECYDISNISGKESVGSMVVATDGKIDKDEYKRFKIKSKDTPDDFEMMYEVLLRRLKHYNTNPKKWPDPNLLVLDGGKGQVGAVRVVLQDLGIDIPLIGLAKKQETIVFWNGSVYKEINLSKRNEGLRLLISLRDESHRFAQSYHHKLRSISVRETDH